MPMPRVFDGTRGSGKVFLEFNLGRLSSGVSSSSNDSNNSWIDEGGEAMLPPS